jgi:hypothetical protein
MQQRIVRPSFADHGLARPRKGKVDAADPDFPQQETAQATKATGENAMCSGLFDWKSQEIDHWGRACKILKVIISGRLPR